MLLSNNSPRNTKLSRVSPCFSIVHIPHVHFRFRLQFWWETASFRIGTYIVSRIEKAKVILFVILIFSFIPALYNNIDFTTVVIIRFWHLSLSIYVSFLWLIDDKLIVYPWEY